MIRELREEVEKLRQMLEISGGAGAGGEGAGAGGLGSSSTREMTELQEKLRISESLMQEMTMTWEQRVKATERIHQVCTTVSPFLSLLLLLPVQPLCTCKIDRAAQYKNAIKLHL